MLKEISNAAQPLADFIKLSRRYSRSINLERDFSDAESLKGYVVTERATQALRQIGETLNDGAAAGAWTLTGVYGTGKSSFAHFLASLSASQKDDLKKVADEIFDQSGIDQSIIDIFRDKISGKGFVRAVATAQREPIGDTIVRALRIGIDSFWKKSSRVKTELNDDLNLLEKASRRNEKINSRDVLNLIQKIRAESNVGLLIVIDELGKCLEFAALNRDAEDLYLLQQIKELAPQGDAPVLLLGLLHQAFSQYGYGLGEIERNEWIKIQGRFEEIPFTESARQMVHLIGQAINHSFDEATEIRVESHSREWQNRLKQVVKTEFVNLENIKRAFPLHPFAALALPQLCLRYAQNDRSLFTFLTGAEPGSLRTFLEENSLEVDGKFPLLKLDRLYDYFVDTAQAGLTAKSGFQRWTEVKSRIDEHLESDPNIVRVLKIIGVLNLAGTNGFLWASRRAVALAMCDEPNDSNEFNRTNKIINQLIERGVITHRRQVDELRLWEGSDFDAEVAVKSSIERQSLSFAELLADARPLRPLVAQRHSYRTGAVRSFECRYFDNAADLKNLSAFSNSKYYDGLLGYWVSDEDLPKEIPATFDGKKPFVLIKVNNLESLRLRSLELAGLQDVAKNAAELQTDGVARREIRHRLLQARNQFDEAFSRCLNSKESVLIWLGGQPEKLNLRKQLNGRLSDLCDEFYKETPVIWNEIINRQVLTSQGAKASRQVIAAMLEGSNGDNLYLSGFGPEVSVYDSVLKRTGIHRAEEGTPGFFSPVEPSLLPVWNEIERFCLAATDQPANLDRLFEKLQEPPFGVKTGLIPILLAAVCIARSDDMSIYKDGIFVPVLGAEHFELLVKNPARFAVKHYFITGVQAQVFKELEDVASEASVKLPAQFRNKNLLGIVSPFLKFARKLPKYTRQTKNVSARAQSVREVLLNSNEPDKLLFDLLPTACGLSRILPDVTPEDIPRQLRTRLSLALKELREAFDSLLVKCRDYLHESFGVQQEIGRLREDLRSRASYFAGRSIEPILTAFVFAATDTEASDDEWLENIITIVADKSIESWTDADIDAFGLKLTDLARRFKHLEAIIKDNAGLWNNRAEARRLSLVCTDGSELHDIAWIDEADKQFLEHKAEEIINGLEFDKLKQRAFLAILTEKILVTEKRPLSSRKNKFNLREVNNDEAHPRLIRRKR